MSSAFPAATGLPRALAASSDVIEAQMVLPVRLKFAGVAAVVVGAAGLVGAVAISTAADCPQAVISIPIVRVASAPFDCATG